MFSAVVRVSLCALLLSPGLCGACPFPCECSEAARTVKCVLKDLKDIPAGIPGYTRNLFITGNQIRRIGPKSFQGLENVTTLSLSNNRINTVESRAFAGLRSLRSLDLSTNQLSGIHPEAFLLENSSLQELDLSQALYNHSAVTPLASSLRLGGGRGLGRLLRLDLSDNGLIFLPPGMFANLSGLQQLDLSNNSLVAIMDSTFLGLDLRKLDLSLNAFKTFKEDSLRELGGQRQAQILLRDNPFVCNCDVEDFARWLNSTSGVPDADRLVCVDPRELHNVSLLSLGELALECHASKGADLALQTSYVFLGIVLGIVGVIFLFVLYLNRKGIKKWIYETRDACRELMEGYHYRYEIESDPRLAQISTTSSDL
ncbi:trophoblast glycoprotein a [Lepisosteus oculatus]|uniref:trophoblast glycoprotein a n=1 Tax=Lepisosteus oculatus TaxID=7918 RepID=UPI0003EAE380|nr:PREDICTED: trophoblast glycoprotein-like [Lepisosteus oculatus]